MKNILESLERRSNSLFSSNGSAWDHIFEDIPSTPPVDLKPMRAPRPSNSSPRPRRQTMTAREISAFDDMFNMIFNAASERKNQAHQATQGASIGAVPVTAPGSDVGDLYTRLRKHSRVRWTSDEDAELDKKKEQMELCESDQDLLEWAMREVFGESKRYEEAAWKAAQAAAKANAGVADKLLPVLQPPSYPHVLALLMRTFRDKYKDPNLALSMFDHARHLSIPSYVFGCTTPAYNELITTRWQCFRDLRGVCETLEEMRVNGVMPDAKTRALVEALRREVGERNLWVEESELGSGEVWSMLNRIEKLVAKPVPAQGPRSRPSDSLQRQGSAWMSNAPHDVWKNPELHEND